MRAERQIVFLLAVALYVNVAVYMTQTLDTVDWDGVATTFHAFDVAFGGEQPSLSRIGFSEAPMAALLQIPLVAAVPSLGSRALVGPITSAVLAALACLMLCKLMAETHAPRWVRWPLLVVFGLNPTWVYAAATGSRAPLVCFLVLACGLCVARWALEGILRDLVLCGFIVSVALMSQLEAVSLAVSVALAIWSIVSAQQGGRARVEATLTTLLLPVAAVAVLWVGTCWAIMGDPLHSLRGRAADDRVWLLVFETALFASFLLWCRWAAATARPVLAGLVPAVLVATAGSLIAGWNGAAPLPWEGYTYLQPSGQDGDTFGDMRQVAQSAAESAGDGLVIVDSEMAFAVALAGGRPRTFATAESLQGGSPGEELSRATHVLTDLRPPPGGDPLLAPVTRIDDLLQGGRPVDIWSDGKWRLVRLAPNVE
jgi:hypothetical protein